VKAFNYNNGNNSTKYADNLTMMIEFAESDDCYDKQDDVFPNTCKL